MIRRDRRSSPCARRAFRNSSRYRRDIPRARGRDAMATLASWCQRCYWAFLGSSPRSTGDFRAGLHCGSTEHRGRPRIFGRTPRAAYGSRHTFTRPARPDLQLGNPGYELGYRTVSNFGARGSGAATNRKAMSADERARLRRSKAIVAKTRLHEDDGSFDRAFWSRYTPSERFALSWEMVREWATAQGIDECQLRLHRSIVRIKRRER